MTSLSTPCELCGKESYGERYCGSCEDKLYDAAINEAEERAARMTWFRKDAEG